MPFTRPRQWLEPAVATPAVRYSGNEILRGGENYSIVQTLKDATPGKVFQIECMDKSHAHFYLKCVEALEVLAEEQHDRGYTLIVRKLLI